MAGTILDESTIPVIRGRVTGELLEPGDDGYDEARTGFKAMIDRRPRLIVRCRGAAGDGRLVHASEDENGDLLGARRGGGGNLGVVTQFEYRLHEVGPLVTGGMVLWPLEQAGEVLRFYRDWIESAPDEVGGGAAIIVAPPEGFVPVELQGKPALAVIPISLGDPDLLRPIREFGSPFADLVGPMPYVEVQKLLDHPNPPGHLNYWKAEAVDELSDDLIDLILSHADGIGSPFTARLIQPAGGALARIPADAAAINPVPGSWVVHAIAVWATEAESERELAWARRGGGLTAPYTRAPAP